MKMVYLSKGYLKARSGKDEAFLIRAGKEYRLHGIQAVMWMKVKYGFCETDSEAGIRAVAGLRDMGLVEAEERADGLAEFRILTRCVCDPVKRRAGNRSSARLDEKERQVMTWIRKAGIHLSVAELVFLSELGVWPEKEFLHDRHRQKLVETLYLLDDVGDSRLEDRMERAASRDEVVSTLMSLLKKRQILIT